jgi:hypothetical protein
MNKNHKQEHNENHKHDPKHHVVKSKSNLKNYFWQIVSFALLVLLIISIVFLFTGNKCVTVKVDLDDGNKIGEETKDFLITTFNLPNLLLKTTVYENNLFLHTFVIEDNEVNIYTSLDGNIIFIPGLEPINKNEINLSEENNIEENQDLKKSEKPIVELFVMSHCPYGIQTEKGILPVIDVLEDSIDFKIKFVNYVMHDLIEINEQVLQHCIQENVNEKYKEYLYCFLEDGDTSRCLTKTDISLDSMQGCITQTNQDYNVTELYQDKSSWLSGRYPKFLIHDEDNKKYSVKGSPTLIINGVQVNSARDSQSLLKNICNAFETKPRACNEQLSSASPTPQFGFEGQGSSTTATCG